MTARKTSKGVAPQVTKSDTPKPSFPEGVAQPAIRALNSVGVSTVEALAKHREIDIADLHGMGPKAMGLLKEALKEKGKSFKK
ncbi:MAG: DNA-binding protein [Gemmatimonadaceae bacterium]